MKRIVSFFLALCCVLSLAACAAESGKDPADTTASELSDDTTAAASDLDYIKAKGEMIIGYTEFAPMNYKDDNGELIGFETEFAKAVCEKIGVTPVFQEINWDAKEVELSSKNIDCIWNGMTITEERAENMQISIPYMENKQAVVVKAD